MRTICKLSDLDSTLDLVVARLVRERLEMLSEYEEDLATIYIIEPGDTLDALAKARGRPFEGWDFIIDHGGWYEAVLIISDDGAGHVVLVPKATSIDRELLDLCRCHAVKAGDAEND